MDPEFFSDIEIELADGVKAALYSGGFDPTAAEKSLAGLPLVRRNLVLEAAIIQVSAEQAQRRRYVIGTSLNAPELDSVQQEALITVLATNPGGFPQLLGRFGLTSDVILTDPVQSAELLEQSKIFALTNTNLRTLNVALIKKERITPFFAPLNGLKEEHLTNLVAQIGRFLEQLKQGKSQELSYDPELPQPLSDLLRAAGVELAFNTQAEPIDRLHFLTNTIYVAQGIIDNRQNKTFDQSTDLEAAIAELLYFQGITPTLRTYE